MIVHQFSLDLIVLSHDGNSNACVTSIRIIVNLKPEQLAAAAAPRSVEL